MLFFSVILLACVGCDHASKQAAVSLLADSAALDLAGGMLRFQLASNPGAFLSLGAELPEGLRSFLLLGLVPILIAAVCLFFARSAGTSRVQLAALAVLAGGGIGNWLDRVLHDGAVTDFVSIGIGGLRTGIFNLADLAVVVGIFWLLPATRRPEPPDPSQAA
ncbi:MAG TPA: signal peptidase II [Myxococcota bacterium]